MMINLNVSAAADGAFHVRKAYGLAAVASASLLLLFTFVFHFTMANEPAQATAQDLLAAAQAPVPVLSASKPSAPAIFFETMHMKHAHMLHDISVASKSLESAAKKQNPKVIQKQWPLVKIWTLAPDENPTQPNSSKVAQEANAHVSDHGRDETEGKWTTPCKAWPFHWPFSPCKEPPPAFSHSKAPTYEIIVNFFRDGSVAPTLNTHVPTFQGACTRCLKRLPPPPPPSPTRVPSSATPTAKPSAGPSTTPPTYDPKSVTIEITLPSRSPTSAHPSLPTTFSPSAAPILVTSKPTYDPNTVTVEVNQYASGTPPGAVSDRIIIPQRKQGQAYESASSALKHLGLNLGKVLSAASSSSSTSSSKSSS